MSDFVNQFTLINRQLYLQEIDQSKETLGIDQLDNDELYVCAECGSLDIEQKHWVNVNTGLIIDTCEKEDIYCNVCNDHRNMTLLSDYLLENYPEV